MKKYLVIWRSGREEIINIPFKATVDEPTKRGAEMLAQYKKLSTVESIKQYSPLLDWKK